MGNNKGNNDIENKLMAFNNEEFGEIRTVIIDNEPWFVGKDIASSLGYKRATKAIQDHVDREDKDEIPIKDSIGRMQKTPVINESGLYALIFGSELESAKKFKHWVTSEVLPSIRKNGGYVDNEDVFIETYLPFADDETKNLFKITLADSRKKNEIIKQQKNEIKTLNTENDLLSEKNLEWADRPLIHSLVRAYGASLGGSFQAAWVNFKKELLYKHSINLNSRITNSFNQTGKKPKTLEMLDDSELPNALSTIIALCRENHVNVSHLLKNKNT